MSRKLSISRLVTSAFLLCLALCACSPAMAQENVPLPLPPSPDLQPSPPGPGAAPESRPLPPVPPPASGKDLRVIHEPVFDKNGRTFSEVPKLPPGGQPNGPQMVMPVPMIKEVAENPPTPGAPSTDGNYPLQNRQPKSPPAFRPIRPPGDNRAETVYRQSLMERDPLFRHDVLSVPPALPQEKAGPALSVQKLGPSTGKIGQVLSYDIVVQNKTGAILHDVVVEDLIPAGAEVAEMVPPGKIENGHIQWQVKSLQPQALAKFQVRLRPMRPGAWNMNTTASLRFQSNLQTTIGGMLIGLDVQAQPQIELGQTALFKITIVNKSTQTMQGLVLTTHLPDGLSHPAGRDIEAELSALNPGETKTIDLPVVAAKIGTLRAGFAVTLPTGEQVLASSDIVVQEGVKLFLKKSGDRILIRGAVKKYRLELLNQGDSDARNVMVVDHLPAGCRFVAATGGGKFDPSTRQVRWNLGTLRPGQIRRVELKMMGEREGKLVSTAQAEAQNGGRVSLQATLDVRPPETPPRSRSPFGFLMRQR